MLTTLLAKDLRRAWRNPLPWGINLLIPLLITALIGAVFGGQDKEAALGRIRFAVVDEDRSVLSSLLRGAVNQNQGGQYLEPVFMERADALKLVNSGKISAVLIIQTNFMRNYLLASEPVSLELIKNPAESIHPAVIEELCAVVVTGLNEISRNFNSEFPEWRRVFEGKEDYHKVSFLIDRAGDKLKLIRNFVNPPLVGYTKEAPAPAQPGHPAAKGNGKGEFSIFAYLLLGMSAMFLLFLGQNAMTDLLREIRNRTFERYQTIQQSLWPFVAGKIVFAVVMLLLCSVIMLGGGGLVFGIHWQNPLALGGLALAYAGFIASFFALLVALMPDERRAAAMNNVAGMALGLVGGCAFPPESLPQFVREHITTLMPSYWFANSARTLQGSGDPTCGLVMLKLLACAVVLTVLAGYFFRRRFSQGVRV